MAIDIKLPELGENIDSADVLNVLVKTGDKIEKDQGVIEIETDKATIEVPATAAGTVKEVLIKSGDKIKVGQTILKVDDGGSNGKAAEAMKPAEEKIETEKEEVRTENKTAVNTAPAAKAGGSKIIEMTLPELGENIESADVLNVLVKTGDKIEKDQGILEIETDKATIEVPATVSGKVVEVIIKSGEKAKVGQTLIKVETGESVEAVIEKATVKEETFTETAPVHHVEKKVETPAAVSETKIPSERDLQPPVLKGAAPAAPSVRRLARELGVDINQVKGTGPNGRISDEDVKYFVKKFSEGKISTPSVGVKQEPLPDFSKFGSIEKKPMSNIRAKTAEHLSYAWSTIPHVTQHDNADITELERIRKSFNPKIEKAGGKLTVTAILLKVVTSALKVFPQFNSSIDMDKKEIIYKKYYNVGVAVDTEHGLIVPVIKNVDQKNLVELSVELNTIAEKARIRKTSLEELQGGCFTITNLGGIGGTAFTPIINSPEVAILGVSRSSFQPVYNDGKFEPRLILPLSLSYDHRIIDGADAARFLRWVCEALEQPIKILIEG